MQKYLYREIFAHKHFYTGQPLHRTLFTQRRFTHKYFHTEQLLHTEAFIQKNLYTETSLPIDTFIHRIFYAGKPLHRATFTYKNIYRQIFLYRTTFGQIHLIYIHFAPRAAFTHRTFAQGNPHTEYFFKQLVFIQRNLYI
jgi:hypothetical protein